MAMSKTSNTYNRQNWEDAEFPILCQTCLGDNPYLRMTKEKYGKECTICSRPFTVFRWCPGAKMRFKKTEICQTCCKLKNVCQTCLLDLEYGLPVQVRDTALTMNEDMPKSNVNKEYYTQNMERELALNNDQTASTGKSQAPSKLLTKLARNAPYYKRNQPHICSFWVKGECKRGEECPYRHEKPTDCEDPLNDQNIRDRYHGTNDPVAEKILRRAGAMPNLHPPEDKSITTLFVGNLDESIGEGHLRDYFYQFGEIRSVVVVRNQQCAFVQFTARMAAEAASEDAFDALVINGRKLSVKWGKSQGKIANVGEIGVKGNEVVDGRKVKKVPGLATLPLPSKELSKNYFNLNQSVMKNGVGFKSCQQKSLLPQENPVVSVKPAIYYPSQDPQQMG